MEQVAAVHCRRLMRIILGLGSGLPDSLLCGCMLKSSQRCRQWTQTVNKQKKLECVSQ